jgi:predicted Fe-S protein YdhL (DUF1289 family)
VTIVYQTYNLDMNPCKRICKLDANQTCIGCGRTWEHIKNWYSYPPEKQYQIICELKTFIPTVKTKFEGK